MALFQSFWHGKELPKPALLCLASFLDHGHCFYLYTYREIAVPRGVSVVDASQMLPKTLVV
jgi:hypothetical protein